ncbi:MAG: SpoIIE family protein phosphatase [Salinivirgaceae bacterium]|nr:SpoIIE family protein phosphatase [Salinivirgaceae bacterium]
MIIFHKNIIASIGYPIITNYTSVDMGVTPQVWGMVQDSKGMLYFATNVGVVKFDGVNWQLYETPSNSAVRSIAIDQDGTIFIGATREFGYLKTDTQGKYSYVSISDSIKNPSFKSVIKTFVIGKAIYFFASHNKIFKYLNGKTKEIYIDDIEYFRAFKINNEIYLLGDFGVAKLINDKIVYKDRNPLPGNFYFLLPYGTNNLLGGTIRNGLFIYHRKQNKWEKLTTEIDQELINNDIYSGILLRNGNYAISTLKGGMYIINSNGNIINKFNKESGLLNNSVYCLFEDKQNDLWAGQEKGFSHIELSTPFTKFGFQSGLDGTLQNIISYNNSLFCATSNGIYYLPLAPNNKWEHSTFKLLNTKYIYNLDYAKIDIPGSTEPLLLASCLRDILWITPNLEVKELFKIYGCYTICTSHKIKGRVYLGSPSGIDVIDLKFVNGNLIVVNHRSIKKVSESIRDLFFSDDGVLWIRTAFNSILKIQFDANESLDSIKVVACNDLTNNYPDLKVSDIKYLDEKIVLSTNYGLLSAKIGTRNTIETVFHQDHSFGLNFNEDSLAVNSIGKDKMGNYWIALKSGIVKYDINKNELLETKYRRLSDNQIQYINIIDGLGTTILTEDELFFINGSGLKNLDFNFSVVINKTTFGNNYKTLYSDGTEFSKIVLNEPLPYSENSVIFEFCAPFYQKSEATTYSWFLEGFDKEWVIGSHLKRVSYTNLPQGNYTFFVKAKNIYNNESNIVSFNFIVETPWYLRPISILLFIVSIILLVWLIVVLYTFRLKKDRKQLQEIIREAIRKEEEQKEEIEHQAEKLLIANKELEKLSIVASKTDNAVIIMDPKGKIQWVNEGYTQMYGFLFDEILHKETKIIGENANVSIDAMVNVWFGERKPIIYENQKETKSGEKVWVQTTLTPILDDSKQLVQLIAIDADITKMKVAEAEIEAQRDEIEAQRDLALQQRDEITIQKKEIIDSIKYANRIQKAVLMNEVEFNNVFPNAFVYNKPRDIVSGDFYWAHETKDVKIIACVDCTGHGVPGAFMSLIGVTFLNSIVKEKGEYAPAKILGLLRGMVIKSLGQTGKEDEAKDGMDVSICVISKKRKKIIFAGANNPSYLISDQDFIEIQADKMPISIYHSKILNFKQTEIDYKVGDMLYLFTDGYVDQFGGEMGKKYKSKRYKNLLMQLKDKSLLDQKQGLDAELREWKGNLNQVDDILVMGN